MSDCVVTTSWDDGHKLDKRLSALLKKYDINGTFYISPKDHEFSSDALLTNAEILEISKDFEIGAHTMTHPDLTSLTGDESRKEIVESKIFLENVIGKSVTSFCYPSGKYTSRDREIVIEEGFTLARTVKRFALSLSKDPFTMSTTLHAYNHWLDALPILRFANFNPLKFLQYYLHWDSLARAMFDRTLEVRGVFHLWGHSWEIDKHGDWERLEEVIRYISSHTEVKYLTNGELL